MKQVSVEEVFLAIQEKKEIILLDVRTKEEFSRGKIEGSINIPVDEISNNITSIIPDKSKTIYVYCLSGSRSDIAAEKMEKLGFSQCFSMKNGLLMWRSQKYPLIP